MLLLFLSVDTPTNSSLWSPHGLNACWAHWASSVSFTSQRRLCPEFSFRETPLGPFTTAESFCSDLQPVRECDRRGWVGSGCGKQVAITEQTAIRRAKKKRFWGWSTRKERKHHDLIMENLHSVNLDVCQEEWGSNREAKLAHVIEVMRERFEDECLLSVPSRADNRELEEESTARRQSSPASYKNHECWSPNLTSLQTYFSNKCFITAVLGYALKA